MAENKEELKSLLMKLKEERENVGLHLNSQKSKIMAFYPITSRQIKTKEPLDEIERGEGKSCLKAQHSEN